MPRITICWLHERSFLTRRLAKQTSAHVRNPPFAELRNVRSWASEPRSAFGANVANRPVADIARAPKIEAEAEPCPRKRPTMKQKPFYAREDDYAALFSAVEAGSSLAYYEMGNFTSAPRPPVSSWTQLEAVGLADADASTSGRSYLVIHANGRVRVRQTGGVLRTRRYLVDQLINAGTVTLSLGGNWRNQALLPGRIATVHDDPSSRLLMKMFDGALRAQFTKVQAYWVGPCAMAYLRDGGRLTPAVQSPPMYDLSH